MQSMQQQMTNNDKAITLKRKPKNKKKKSYILKTQPVQRYEEFTVSPKLCLLGKSHHFSFGKGSGPNMSASAPLLRFVRVFQTTAAVGANLTLQNVHDQFMIAGTTTTAYPQFIAWRIRRIRIWASCTSTTEGVCTLSPLQNAGISDNIAPQSENMTIVSETTTIDEPAHIDFKCPRNQPIGCYHNTSTTNLSAVLAYITITDPGLLELDVEGIQPINQATPGYTRTIVAGTAGNFYAKTTLIASLMPIGVITI